VATALCKGAIASFGFYLALSHLTVSTKRERMSDYSKISKRMKEDWDRRVDHNYRFWMSDGHESDEVMWSSGERDFKILTRGIEETQDKALVEIGCGVGRLLKAAGKAFKQVIGVDVSSRAIAKAKDFLAEQSNVEVWEGNGVDLKPLPDGSVDVVVSFAALTSAPTAVIAKYFTEMHRVLRDDGVVRLQAYLGEPQSVYEDDTLHIRCFTPDDFQRAVEASGFAVEWIEELKLPIQVSFEDIGITAQIISLRKLSQKPASPDIIASLLLPEGEVISVENKTEGVQDLECWMSLNYAMQLAEQGDTERAKDTLEFVVLHSQNISIDVRDLMDRIVAEIERREGKDPGQEEIPQQSISSKAQVSAGENFVPYKAEVFEKNMRVLQDRFPQIHSQVEAYIESQWGKEEVEIRETSEGPVIFRSGQCLDHPAKPAEAGVTWANRLSADKSYAAAEQLVIYGVGSGYHLEALMNKSDKVVSVIEPSIEGFCLSLSSRDWTKMLGMLKHFHVGTGSIPEFLDSNSELYVRPQAQLVDPEYCGRLSSAFYGERGLSLLSPRLAVLGPLQGGTLPIAGYASRALLHHEQRVRTLDMSGFAAGFHQMDNFVRDDVRKSLLRGTYAEMLSQVILEAINEKPIDVLICMAQAPITGRALDELRKQGVVTVLWFMEDFLRFRSWEMLAQHYDFVFTIQRGECVDAIKRAGAGHVQYLPVACDPFVHMPVEVPQEERSRWGSPVSFVGAGYHNRQQTFASMVEFPFKIWGTEWPECRPFDSLVQEKGRRVAPEEYVKIFNSTDVNINLHSSTERDGVDPGGDFLNPRTFELAACGAFQLVDERAYLSEVFEPGKELVTFRDTRELKEKVAYYLEHPDERRQIAQASRERVLREHTYGHRMKEMLSIIYSVKYEHLKNRDEQSPWKKMLRRTEGHDELHRRCKAAYKRGEEPILDGLVADIVTGEGALSETEQKLLFLFHVRKQIIRMKQEERGGKGPA